MCKKYEDLNELEKLEVICALQQYLDDINYRKIKETSKVLEDELIYIDNDIKRTNDKIKYFNEKLTYSKDDSFYMGILATIIIVLTQTFTSDKVDGMSLVFEGIIGTGLSGVISSLINDYRKKRLEETNSELNDLTEFKEDIEKRLNVGNEVAKVYKFTHSIK